MAQNNTPTMIERVALRPIAVFILSVVPVALLATLIVFVRPGQSVDDLAVTTAMPFVVFYILARGFAALVDDPSPSEIEEAARIRARVPTVVMTIISVQVYALIAAVIALLTGVSYGLIGISWAWTAALKVSGVCIGVSAASSVLCGFTLMAMQSHASGGFVGKCHTMLLLFTERIREIAGALDDAFSRHTAIRPAH